MDDSSETEIRASEAETTDVLTVRELNDRIAAVVENTPDLHAIRCIGEVTDLSESNAAVYFSLTDGEAELPCMLWRNRYRHMDLELDDGLEVIVEGDLDFWTEGGTLDLKPWEITVAGEGDRAAALQRLRAELEARGWFDDEHKQRPPQFPERVGVVTSLQGDARYDIQNAIHDRDPTVDLVIKDANVQGERAPESIANGVHHLDRNEDTDVIVVGRGGGSDSNLLAFNTETVAEAIFTAETPIVTAVGHTEDRTIADRGADVAAITPTAAGEYVVESREEFVEGRLEPLEQGLDAAYEAFEREHEHERRLKAAREAREVEGIPRTYYKITIVVLVVLLLVVLGLWLGVV